MIANSSTKRPAEGNSEEIHEASHQHQAKDSRPKRHCLLKEGTTPGRTSSNILPQICMICKRSGPLYITDAVNKFYVCFLYKNRFKFMRKHSSCKKLLLAGVPSGGRGRGATPPLFLKIVGNL